MANPTVIILPAESKQPMFVQNDTVKAELSAPNRFIDDGDGIEIIYPPGHPKHARTQLPVYSAVRPNPNPTVVEE